jgi:hypothetical protein
VSEPLPEDRQATSRRPGVIDLVAVLLMAAGTTLVIVTGDPVWTSSAAVGAAALGLGGLRGRWLAALLSLLALAWAVGVVVAVLDDSLWGVHDTLVWGAQAAALAIGATLAVVAVRRATAAREEVERALEFAQDVTVHDPLTDLANRKGLDLLGEQILESARRRGDAD